MGRGRSSRRFEPAATGIGVVLADYAFGWLKRMAFISAMMGLIGSKIFRGRHKRFFFLKLINRYAIYIYNTHKPVCEKYQSR